MATRESKREESRERIVVASGRAFRRSGFAGIGVDGLAKGADLTSGAFYFHFRSKLEVFIEAVRSGLEELKTGVRTLQAEAGSPWLERFAGYYLGYKRTCGLENGCTLPSLSSDVERAGDQARAAYEVKLRELVEEMEKGLTGEGSLSARQQAWSALALLSGGVTMARAVRSAGLSEEIAEAVMEAVKRLH